MKNNGKINNDKDRLLTVDELAGYLRFHKTVIYSLIKNGNLPVYRVSGQWRFRESEIEEWLKKQNLRENEHANGDTANRSSDGKGQNSRNGYYETACSVLEHSGLLMDLPVADLNLLLENLKYEHLSFSKGDHLIRREEKLDSFLILYDGKMSIPYGFENHVLVPDSFHRESIIGLDVLFTPLGTSYFDLYAETDGNAVWYNFDYFVNSDTISPRSRIILHHNILNYVGEENIRRFKKIEFLQMNSIDIRILLYLMQKERAYGGSPFQLDRFFDVSNHLNISNSSFSTHLKNLKQKGIIKLEGRTVWINNQLADEYLKKEEKRDD